MDRDDIISAVIKRAKGYAACETVEEYAVVDGSLELVKKRVTTKDVPPDMTAAKMLFDDSDFSSMTDEMLEAERKRLLLELDEERKTECVSNRQQTSNGGKPQTAKISNANKVPQKAK